MGIVRLSGPQSFEIAQQLFPPLPPPRQAALRAILDAQGERIDEGVVLAFEQPHSFTGEDVVEVQAHGSPVVLNLIVESMLACGARVAEPGEFSKRAYLNDRIDLVQAEAVADLIEASTVQAARAATQSLQGVFSAHVNGLVDDLTQLRVYVEASLDFPDEDVDFLADGQVLARAEALFERLDRLIAQAKQGERLTTGAQIALVGEPNAGKSSLLNALAKREAAIVTEIAGTTRDVVTEHLNIGGVAVMVSDTAGLRETEDRIEAIGIERASTAMQKADLIIWVIDGQALGDRDLSRAELLVLPAVKRLQQDYPALQDWSRVVPVVNKIDLSRHQAGYREGVVWLSAKNGDGMGTLHEVIVEQLGLNDNTESLFSARARHITALNTAKVQLFEGVTEIKHTGSGELLAESLRQAADALGEITGKLTADELLGKIFSSFCIGK